MSSAIAHARFQRISPRKLGQVLPLIRGKSIAQAYQILSAVKKVASPIVFKTLASAHSNLGKSARPEMFFVEKAWVTGGSQMKRMRPGPMGRSMIIRKRSAHLTVVVSDGKN